MAAIASIVVLAIGVQNGAARTARTSSGLSYLYNQHGSSVPTGFCPNLSCTNLWLRNGTAVRMVCYVDMGINTTGNYTSNRWFYVTFSNVFGSRSQWVHSSYVYYQIRVSYCT